jgi:signal transduction histidine kinase
VISEALSQLDIELRERKPQVNVTEPLPQVMAHRRTLVQVITNLLSNAIKFIEPDVQPQVRVWAQSRGDSIRLWVVDNGLGIAVEHQERIFRVFERLHGIEAYPGTGIGLAIVRKGMERLGGRVGVESQLGQGSRFWIELPKSQMNGEEWRVRSGE